MHLRLKKFLSAENITQAAFAEAMGIGKANVSHILSGRNKPGYEFIKALMQNYPLLSLEWLILGTGKMYAATTSERVSPEAELFPDESEVVSLEGDVQDVDSAAGKNVGMICSSTIGNPVESAVKQRKVSKKRIIHNFL